MADSIQPIVRGEFHYIDAFLVDVGGPGKRHARASESELKDLLNGKTAKDQVAHFYEAQVIHYGLARSKDKNTCKVRLQDAINKKALQVPMYVVDLEGQMKKEYASAVRKAKAKAKNGGDDAGKAESVKKVGKRKNEEVETTATSAKRTKISIEMDGMTVSIDRDAVEGAKQKSTATATKGKQKATSATTNVKEKPAKANAASMPVEAPKKSSYPPLSSPAAKLAPAQPLPQPPQASAQSDSTKKPRPKNSKAEVEAVQKGAEFDNKAKPGSQTKAEPKLKQESKAKSEPKVKPESRFKSEPKVKAEPRIKPEPKVKKESAVRPEAKLKREPSVDPIPDEDKMDIVQPATSGEFNIFCEQVTNQYPQYNGNLRMSLDHDSSGNLWGEFDMANWSGVLKATDPSVHREFTFGWRATNVYDGSQRYGRGCNGRLAFIDGDRLRGVIYDLFPEPVHFDGALMGDLNLEMRPCRTWEGNWSRYLQRGNGERCGYTGSREF